MHLHISMFYKQFNKLLLICCDVKGTLLKEDTEMYFLLLRSSEPSGVIMPSCQTEAGSGNSRGEFSRGELGGEDGH